MKLVKIYQKEITNLNFSIAMALALFLYTSVMFAVEWIREGTNPALKDSLLWPAVSMLGIWLLGLIALAYLRYRRISLDSKELNTLIQGMSTDVVLAINPNREILICNEDIFKIFGWTPQEVLGKQTDFLYRDRSDATGSLMGIHEQLEKLGFHVGHAKGIHKNATEIPLEIITGNLRGHPGAVLQLRDITNLYQAERAVQAKVEAVHKLERSLRKLKEAEEARDSLAQMIVHDMKAPLQVIHGNLELIKDAESTSVPERESLVDDALSQIKRLADMATSILAVSRLESGQFNLNRVEVNIREVVDNVVRSLRGIVKKQHLSVRLPDHDIRISADPDILGRVITNLVSNAIQHAGADATIQVSLSASENRTRLTVQDDGPGIAEEIRGKVFHKFTRFNRGDAGTASTGLGLTFCKLAVEAHEGVIGFESSPEKGCMFWIDLPLTEA